MSKFLIYCTILIGFLDLCHSQQIYQLNSFKGNNVANNLNITGIQGIYFSGSTVPENYLNNIIVKTTNNTQTLLQLRNNKPTGQLQPFLAYGSASIVSALTNDQMSTLFGLLYITSVDQTADRNFIVFDSVAKDTINVPVSTTMVFFNTNYDEHGLVNLYSRISNWQQNIGSDVRIGYGIPGSTLDSTIFTNPVDIVSKPPQFFANIEPIGLKLEYFYVSTTGKLSFQIEQSKDYTVDGSKTTSVSTTGFYMKPLAEEDSTVTINTIRDGGYTGTSGVKAKLFLPPNAEVDYDVVNGVFKVGTIFKRPDSLMSWSADTIGQKIVITGKDAIFGSFYLQYYTIQGGAVTKTTPKVETTTKATNSFEYFISILTIIFAYYLV